MSMYAVELNAALRVEIEAETKENAKCYITEILNEISETYGIDIKYHFSLIVERDDDDE
ncbi:hypothetical protein [Gallibacterium salpingitidis]|uniref:hypothetical protein n=1 Tax=Gallibacterium salpingitidis TaxID=505341 RepID=UPI0012E8232A|nr:hypothetical protein [Gallibacterium salpingitidis]